jgi:chorismate-pyruvate lyase
MQGSVIPKASRREQDFGLEIPPAYDALQMGDAASPTASRPDAVGDLALIANGLASRHFVLQPERPSHLGGVDLVAMDPCLRSLLLTDGTVTRTLEAQTLLPVSVEVMAQEDSLLAGGASKLLEATDGTAAIMRRVAISVGSPPRPVVWAESHIVPDRLPAGFLGVLGDSRDGIGESLQRVRLESAREMLWFGLGEAPDWSQPGAAERAFLLRLYRVIAQGRPAMLISETFAMEQRAGVYHLAS